MKLFRELLQSIEDHGARMKELIAHVNHVILPHRLELVPSGVGHEIIPRNAPMDAPDQQYKVRRPAQDFFHADLGIRLGHVSGNRLCSGSQDNIVNERFAAGRDDRVIPDHDENLTPR